MDMRSLDRAIIQLILPIVTLNQLWTLPSASMIVRLC